MQPYDYQKPTTLAEASVALAQPGAMAFCGGTDVIPQMQSGRRSPSILVDVKHIPELQALEVQAGGGLLIGAATSAHRIAHSDLVANVAPVLGAVARLIGSVQVQARASFGGNICNGAPSGDAVPALIALGATAHIATPGGMRQSLVEELFVGPGQTSLAPGEFLISLEIPPSRSAHERNAAHYQRFTPRREMDIAIVGVAAHLVSTNDGRISQARIALASVAPTPIRARAAEAVLQGENLTPEVIAAAAERAAADDAHPISDTRATAT